MPKMKQEISLLLTLLLILNVMIVPAFAAANRRGTGFSGTEPVFASATDEDDDDGRDVSVTFKLNGGMFQGTVPGGATAEGLTFDMPAGVSITLFNAVKTGHTLQWQDGSGALYAGGARCTINGDTVFNAVWTPETYTVSFDANAPEGAAVSGSMDPMTVTYGVKYDKPACGFTVEGCTFIGWRDRSGHPYNTDQLTFDEDITLYAQWQTEEYTVAYDPNGGSVVSPASFETAYGTVIRLASSERPYYTLKWQDSNGALYAPGAEYTVTANVTFTAVWTPIEYTVLVDYGYKTVYMVFTVEDVVYTKLGTPDEWAGYIFTGTWFDQNNEEIDPDAYFTPAFTGIAANWTVNTTAYTVTWVIDGVEERETYRYGQTPAHAAPAKAADAQYCYTFSGWTPAIVSVTGDAVYTAGFTARAHSFTKYVYQNDATCTNDGTEIAACDFGCGKTDTRTAEGSALGHDYGEPEYIWSEDLTQVTARVVCSRDNTHVISETAKTTKKTVPPTCTEDGVEIYTVGFNCKLFWGQEKKIPIAKLGHKEKIIPGTPSNCTVPGLTDGVICERCGETLKKQKELPLDPDAHVFKVTVYEPTCTDDGYTSHACTLCRYGYSDEIVPSPGHKEKTVPGTPATCTEAGKTDGTVCERCGETLTAQTEIKALGHKEKTVPGTPATCTEAGKTDGTVCERCGETLTAQTEIPSTGHKYGGWTKLDDTQHQRVCANDASHIEKEDHAWDAGKITAAATCKDAGVKTFTCTVCGAAKTEAIPKAAAHTPGETVKENEKPATCQAEGSCEEAVYCTVCKAEISRTAKKTEKRPHTPGALPALAATCTETGLTGGYKCLVCGEILTAQKEIPALGHNYGAWTKLNENQHQRVCANDASHIEKEDHTWNDGEVTREATVTQEGEKTFTCTVCGEKKTEPIEKLPDTTSDFMPGDVNGDGKVTAADARFALRRAVGLETYEPGSAKFLACDVDGNGKVTASDARKILRAAVGLEKLK